GLFDSIGACVAQQFVLLPYYFAVFHQNKERHLLREITGRPIRRDASEMKVGLFTDTLDDVNGVARFIRDMGEQASASGCQLMVHTCTASPRQELPWRKNFEPLLARPLPYYKDLSLNLPPLLECLEWADRQQFDAVHVSTPGPMGLVGWAVSRMLRVPLLGTYHTDFPAYIDQLTRDHRVTNGAVQYFRWFYGPMAGVFSRSKSYRFNLVDLGIAEEKLRNILPGINTEKFNARHRDPSVWAEYGVREPRRVLYCGRVSIEKNLPLLVEAFRLLSRKRQDVALVIAGEGPYLAKMKEELAGTGAYFLGYRNDAQLGPLYASADLFVFPSRTDTLGQVVMEAQASGLPAIVSNEGGPKETVEHDVTGLILPATDPARWAGAIDELLSDEPRRLWMSSNAAPRLARSSSLARTFESFWNDHAEAAFPPLRTEDLVVPARSVATL
ncbi:MAG: glycosyltransferase family 4 protein, partial [Tepidisphaeraceae bacterium]